MNEYSISIDLTDGWIPVIDGKCSLPLEFCQSIECRFDDGQIRTLPYGGGFMSEIIAVRLIKQKDKLAETEKQRLTREAYTRYKASHPEPHPVSMIGEEQINEIAAAALIEHDKVWPVRL